MSSRQTVEEAVDAALPTDRALRIQQDARRVEELRQYGFMGPAYEVFENDLCRQSMPILRGMVRNGDLARLTRKRFEDRQIPFFVSPDNARLLHSSPQDRDELVVDTLLNALKSFRSKALVKGEWSPAFRGPRGASCLTSFFIGQCIWEFRRVYLKWARRREELARQEAALLDVEAFFRLLMAPDYLAEPEAVLFGTKLVDLLAGHPAQTQAVIRMTVEGYQDSEIADALKTNPGAVRTRRYRFRSALYQAARTGQVWIPQQLHTTGAPRQAQRGAA
ncbi:RNA polymerase sigma factor [Streptomyces sp. NPDC088354]|uniref:RNA polymerase sigma factor n=1 Tax=Streptomyces sp. NPDC088354 TaxID=3365856 RepID=UPI003819C784